MVTAIVNIKVGKLYTFNYHGHYDMERVVKVVEIGDGWFKAEDLTNGGYRTFSFAKGIENLKCIG